MFEIIYANHFRSFTPLTISFVSLAFSLHRHHHHHLGGLLILWHLFLWKLFFPGGEKVNQSIFPRRPTKLLFRGRKASRCAVIKQFNGDQAALMFQAQLRN
jgi:hypothetical protein